MQTNTTTVQAIYEAFGRGDIPFILDQLADEVQWEFWADNSAQMHKVPFLKAGRGKQAALDYFGVIGQLNVTHFEPLSFMAGGNQVAVPYIVETAPSSLSTGYRDEAMHLWNFNNEGKVASIRHYMDTFKIIQAFKPAE